MKFSPKLSACLILTLAFILTLGTGCETNGTVKGEATLAPTSGPLQIGDKIRVELNGTPTTTLPQEQTVADDGTITFLNIGPVQAKGKTPRQLEEDILAKLVPDYYKKATITITPINNRYFFVGGYVTRADRYIYEGSTTLTRAIQAAGDFNEFADRKKITLTRHNSNKPQYFNWYDLVKHPEKDPIIYPGDSINVPRRFW